MSANSELKIVWDGGVMGCLRCCLSTCPQERRKTTKRICPLGQGLKKKPPEYRSGVLYT
jgi:hypothetical protein